ncbi:hypothetical protein BWI17_01830 [Betaproteobacteria bacterium GR16-43]|nr:hypothetical protein BWI17_01830 [Betaproteobacteria bacterium GR16-43]
MGTDCRQQTGGMYFNVEGYRSVASQWIMPEGDEAAWLYRRVGEFAVRAARWYQFEVTGFFEPLMFLRYGASDHFDWHLDCGPDGTCTRKLSISIQLTPEDDYEGGDLEFFPQGGSLACRKLGTAIVFPSFYAHRITPVTRGTRSTLVVWLHGPTFR